MKMATYSSGSAIATGRDLAMAYCASAAHGTHDVTQSLYGILIVIVPQLYSTFFQAES